MHDDADDAVTPDPGPTVRGRRTLRARWRGLGEYLLDRFTTEAPEGHLGSLDVREWGGRLDAHGCAIPTQRGLDR